MTFFVPWNRSASISVNRDNFPIGFQNELNQVFDRVLKAFHVPALESKQQNLLPAIDIVENDNGFKVEAELPGMKQEDIEVNINDNILTIKGEKKTSKDDENKNYLCKERYYGVYERMLTLPTTADINNAKASFKKGVLWVEIPKKIQAAIKSRKLEIKEAA